MIDVRAVRAFRIAVDAQRRGFQIAAIRRLITQRVLAHEILLERFIRRRGQERALGQQLDLQRQQIAEDAGERDHHVDAGPAEFRERNQRGAGDPAVGIESGPRADERECLPDGGAFGLQIVRAP